MILKPIYRTLLVLMFLSTTVIAAPPEGKGGNGGGGGDGDESLPIVRYSIDVVPSPASNADSVQDMNSLGMFIGNYRDSDFGFHPYLYDQPTGVYYDILTIDSLVAQVELKSPGFRFKRLYAINDLGAITGYVYDPLSDQIRGVVIETFLSLDPGDWIVSLLPDFAEPGTRGNIGLRINNKGDILGLYDDLSGSYEVSRPFLYNPWLDTDETPRPPVLLGFDVRGQTNYIWLNNHGQVAGPLEDQSLFFYDPMAQEPLDVFDLGVNDTLYVSNQVGGLNDSGVISGNLVDYQFGGKGKRNDVVYRFTNQLEVVAKETPHSAGSARINSSNDVVYVASDSSGADRVTDNTLVHTGFSPDFAEQRWNIKDLIAVDDPYGDLYISGEWSVGPFGDRSDVNDATGYPQIVVNGVSPLVLTPFVPEP